MPHSATLITMIAAGFGLALVFGFIAVRLRLPALVGYLVAGILIGPHSPGFVADPAIAGQLAEIGVMLLMFGVGLHFSMRDLLAVGRIAVPGALLQMLIATMLGSGLALWWGWSIGGGIVFGLALSVASTVVFLKAIESHGAMDSVNSRIAIGWLVVQDLIMVLVLVLLPPLAGDQSVPHAGEPNLLMALTQTIGWMGLFVLLMLVFGRRFFPWVLWRVAHTNSRELFTLCVVAAAVGIAYISSAVFGVSFALGAFIAGMVLRESKLSYRAAQESLPLRDAFSVLFFVSIGMLFDPRVLIDLPMQVLAVVGIIVVGKSLAAFVLVLLFRYPLNTALTVSASLAQIGEFSFILAGLGVHLGVLPVQGQNLILAGALISIAINPLVFQVIEPAQKWIRARSRLARALERSDDPLAELPMTVHSDYVTGHVVLVGYGRVGRRVGEALAAQGLRFVVADENRELVEDLRERGVHAVAGNAAEPEVLIQAHIARAGMLVIATPDTFHVRRMIEIARMLNPAIDTVVRTHSDAEAALLREENAGMVFIGEHELARGMIRHVLDRVAAKTALDQLD